ncbi:hypothetical protein [Novosphingobium sp.]|uniref:hypothetical protein n=1 Tax=Novosphingobium sp. TaxID=1874826 RepID=UPI002732B9A3|nr:hypothetical protein [Novosphingobium sp.]MDP3907123.1 hypothetical protein [Novosphingobium sp.]
MANTDTKRGIPGTGATIASAITLLTASLGMSAEAAPPTDGPTIFAKDAAASHQQKMSSAQHKKVKLETAEGTVDSVQHKHDSLQHKTDSVQHKLESRQGKFQSRQIKLEKLDSQQIKLKTVEPGQ